MTLNPAQFDYRGRHQPPATGAPIHDLTNPEHDSAMPDDVYSKPHFYDHSSGRERYDRESAAVVRGAQGQPNRPTSIFRAVPRGVEHINPGDWVATSKTYAKQHAMSNGEDDWHVLEAKVPAKHVRTGGNDIVEWGYGGPEPIQAKVHVPPKTGWR